MNSESSDYSSVSSADHSNSREPQDFRDHYRATLEARAVYQEAQRVEMLMNYANVNRSLVQRKRDDLERAEEAFAEAKLKVMRASVQTLADLAIKVLVAAEDGFQSKEINLLLEQDARRIIAL